MKRLSLMILFGVLALTMGLSAPVLAEDGDGSVKERWVIEDVFTSGIVPFAIGHRGYGENMGEFPDRPIENTKEAVRLAFREGVQIVEVDAVLTRDGQAVALHDDFLDDYTCVNTLSFKDLRDRLEDVSTLRHVLQKARAFSMVDGSDRPGGLVIVEIKTPSPLCDPSDSTIPQLVDAVLDDVTMTGMGQQVMVESFSPEILSVVSAWEPGIPLVLTIDILQLLPPEVIEELTGMEVTLIDKDAGFGLQWGEIGPLYRLPGYTAIDQYAFTMVAVGARSASLDKRILLQMADVNPAYAAAFTGQLHGMNIAVLVHTIENEAQWEILEALGVDGMYVNDIPLGLTLEGN
ncbi:MAG: glycerophosphodiester phosphodiesterase [bacterium]|nr:MAG: glycerophosphodiester phosphodiesterase [bacterium]